jgi:hypothetical protein
MRSWSALTRSCHPVVESTLILTGPSAELALGWSAGVPVSVNDWLPGVRLTSALAEACAQANSTHKVIGIHISRLRET